MLPQKSLAADIPLRILVLQECDMDHIQCTLALYFLCQSLGGRHSQRIDGASNSY